jgi:chaperonin cofactor prefoldin
MILSELANFFSRLSESAGLHPNIMICMLLLLILLFISAGFILLKLRRADRVLIAVERELDALALNLGEPSPGANLSQNHPNNSGLKNKILDLISKTDKSISLQHLVKHLSEKYFDGNYHPVLNELEQLERDGEIEGQVISGKVFFKKKQKTTRKYILRKGKNFQKYIG